MKTFILILWQYFEAVTIDVDAMSEKCSPLQVVVYTDAAGIGGAEISLGHLISEVSSNVSITVLGVSTLVISAIAAKRPHTNYLVLPGQGARALTSHLATLHRLNPAIMHFNLCTPWACTPGLAAAMTLPKTRIVRVDQLPLRTTDAFNLLRTRALSLRVDAHVAVGDASARRMEDFYALGRHTVRSVPNGVPDFSPKPTPLTEKRPDRQLVVGSVGRLDAMKGYDVLLHAIAQVDGVRAVILGEGEQRAGLEQLAIELGIENKIELPGWASEPRAYLPTYDVFVLPSRSEGFPLAIVEAMLASLPIIATRVGSVAEAVMDNETGILVEKDDSVSLAAAICRLRDDAVLRDRFGQRGREVALANFTANKMAQRYEQIWQEVLAVPRSPRLAVKRPRD